MAGTGPQYVESSAPFPGHDWTHLALAFEQDYAVHLSTGYLDAGSKDSLDITADFSCEVTVALDDLDAPHGLLTFGGSPGAPTNRVPYALRVEPDGTLVFPFVDGDGAAQSVRTDPGAVSTPGRLYRIGVVRKVSAAPDPQHPTAVTRWTDITFVVDGTVLVKKTYSGPDAGSGTGPLHLGRVYGADGAAVTLRGTLTEARVWRKALDVEAVGARINGSEAGLVAWWRLAEGSGNVTADAKGTAPATLRGGVSWVKTPDPTGSPFQVYRDGVPVVTTPVPAATYAPTSDGFILGGTDTDRFAGQLEELRIWRTRRTTEQLAGQHVPARRGRAVRPGRLLHVRRRAGSAPDRPGAAGQHPGRGRGELPALDRAGRGGRPAGAQRRRGPHQPLHRTGGGRDGCGRVRRPAARGRRVRTRRLQALLRPGRRRGPLAARHRLQGRRPGRRVGGPGPVRPAAHRVHRRRATGAQREPHRRQRQLHRGQLGRPHRGGEHHVHLRQLPHGGHRRLRSRSRRRPRRSR